MITANKNTVQQKSKNYHIKEANLFLRGVIPVDCFCCIKSISSNGSTVISKISYTDF